MKAPLVLLAALFIASAHQTLSGDTFGDWTYSVSGSQATITGYSGVGGPVEIPALVNEISVLKVGAGSFSIFGDGNTTVTSVTIPDSVTSIGGSAFFFCTSLVSITIPDSVTSFGPNAFYSCTSLTDITIPDSVTSIGSSAFSSCTSLTGVTIGNSVTSIAEYAFSSCTSLTGITIPDSVTSIGEYAFSSCTSFTSITIPDSVASIGEYAFSSCTSLTRITIPDSVTSIGSEAFSFCTSLTDVTIGNSVTSIWDNTFTDCTSLTDVTIGNSVTSIGPEAFSSCTSLASITIPDSVTSIGENAFDSCTSLTSITLPATLFVWGTYSSYSLSSEQVRVEKTSIDAFVANAATAARTVGQADVTSDPATYSLYTAGDVSNAEAASRILGQQDVTNSPSLYDLHTSTELAEATAAARTIVNVSARVNIGAGETIIPGFVVLGESKQLLIRAVGPKLADLGVPSPLPDPTMTIYRTRYDGQPNDVVAIIDNWKEQPEQADGADVAAINAAMATAGAFPLEPTETFQGRPFMTDDTKSAATLITLSVGVYTVVVTSADGDEGDVLVEAYEIY